MSMEAGENHGSVNKDNNLKGDKNKKSGFWNRPQQQIDQLTKEIDSLNKQIRDLQLRMKNARKDKNTLLEEVSELSAYLRREGAEKKAMHDKYSLFFGEIAYQLQKLLGFSKAGDTQRLEAVCEDIKDRIRSGSRTLCEIPEPKPAAAYGQIKIESMKDAADLVTEAKSAVEPCGEAVNYQRAVLSILCILAYNGSGGLMEKLAEEITEALNREGIIPMFYDDFAAEDVKNRSVFVEIHEEAKEIPGLFIRKGEGYQVFGDYAGLVSREKKVCEGRRENS